MVFFPVRRSWVRQKRSCFFFVSIWARKQQVKLEKEDKGGALPLKCLPQTWFSALFAPFVRPADPIPDVFIATQQGDARFLPLRLGHITLLLAQVP